MATKKITLSTGQEVEVEIIGIKSRDDPPIFIDLEDGAKIRLRVDVMEVCRTSDQWDHEGNPIYHLKTANFMTVTECPEHLKKPPAKPAGNGQS